MVDSENSTSLSSVSRRELLTGAAATPLLPVATSLPQLSAGMPTSILPLWREWLRLHSQAMNLCHRWQCVEMHLIRKVGFPQVRIPNPDQPAGTCAQSHVEIDRALAAVSCSAEESAALHADFAARQARWDAEAEKLGFDAIKQQETEAWHQGTRVSDAIFEARATSLIDIEIKIALIIELCSTGSDDPESPWPELRSTLADVKRLRCAFGTVRC
jgi:hypothetical protein